MTPSTLTPATSAPEYSGLRHTLYIGLGGFGCTVIRKLKKNVQELAPEHIDGYGFLGLDTQALPSNDILTHNEYVPLSLQVSPKAVVPLFPEQLSWFSDVFGNYIPGNIMGGAAAIRALGRFAFRNPSVVNNFLNSLGSTTNRLLEPRQAFVQNGKIKVYVVSSLAGGTGSGCLLDVLAIVGACVKRLGGHPNFPYQAILATPEALLGALPAGAMSTLFSNSYSLLKELHHFVDRDPDKFWPITENYDGEEYSQVEVSEIFPQAFHIIGNRNEANAVIVSGFPQLAELTSRYLLSEIQTPMRNEETGTPRLHDLENQESVINVAGKAVKTLRRFSSFGIVQFGVPAEILGRQWSLRIAFAALNIETLETSSPEDASQWISSNQLTEAGNDQFQNLFKAPLLDQLRISVDTVGTLMASGTSLDDLHARASTYCEKIRREVKATKLPLLGDRTKTLREILRESLASEVISKVDSTTVGLVVGFLSSLTNQLKAQQTDLTKEAASCSAALQESMNNELLLTLGDVQTAAESSFFGRKNRVTAALSDFGVRLEAVLVAELDLAAKEQCLSLYSALLTDLGKLLTQWKSCLDILKQTTQLVEQKLEADNQILDQRSNVNKLGAGNTLSLITSKQADALYNESFQKSIQGITQLVRRDWLNTGVLVSDEPNRDKWVDGVYNAIKPLHVDSVLSRLTILEALDRFYPDAQSQSRLFQTLGVFSAPMFWLDVDKAELEYPTFWVIAVHSDLQEKFETKYKTLLSGDGINYAHSSSRHEIAIHQLKLGYTLGSHKSLMSYQSAYKDLSHRYANGTRPIHAWPGAADWDEPLPQKGEEAAIQSFVLGRAFATLFPLEAPVKGKRGTFLFSSGAYYYLSLDEDKRPVDLGNGLEEALEELASHTEWQKQLQKAIEAKISELGRSAIKDRLVQDYVPLLTEEIEKAEGGTDQTRAKILRKLQAALKKYIQKELTSSAV